MSVPVLLGAPTFICPAPLISTVPLPLKPPLALTVPPLAANVPLLSSALLMFSVPVVACISPPAAFCTPPLMATFSALLWFAVTVPRLTSDSPPPAPIWPAPWTVWPAPTVNCAPAASATMRLFALLLSVVVPLPASVAMPTMRRSVMLPPETTLTVPVLLTVPCKRRKELSTTLNVPALVRFETVAVLPPTVVTWPLPVVAKVPPLTTALPPSCTTPALMALSVPPAPWVKLVPPVMTTVPASARTALLLVTAPELTKVSGVLKLPTTVPLLVKLNCVPAPICPAPCKVWPLPSVRLSPAAAARIRLFVRLLRLMVPVPSMLRLPAMRKSVTLPPDCRFITPLFVSEP